MYAFHVPVTGNDKANGTNKRAVWTFFADPFPQDLYYKWVQLTTNDYSRQTRGLLYTAQHCHSIKWYELDIDVNMNPINDRFMLSQFGAFIIVKLI